MVDDRDAPYELAYTEAVRALSQQQTVLGLTLFMLWPRKDWEFVVGPRRLIATYVETDHPLPLHRIHRDVALHMENSYDENTQRLQRLIWRFVGRAWYSHVKSSDGSSTSQLGARLRDVASPQPASSPKPERPSPMKPEGRDAPPNGSKPR